MDAARGRARGHPPRGRDVSRTASAPVIAYQRRGQGPPVLLVMGLGMRGRVWAPQVDDLSRDHEVIAFDNRGIGDSEAVRGWPTMDAFADDARRVLDDAGWDTAHVVGVSLGGMIAQALTLAHPSRVRSLTLIATHAGGPAGLMPRAAGLRAFLGAMVGPRQGRVAALQALLYPPAFLAAVDPAALRARIAAQLGERAAPETLRAQLAAVARFRAGRRLAGVRVPTLVIRPDADVLIRPAHSDRLARSIPGAKLLALPDAGHGVTFQCATQVSAAIRAHVADAVASGS